MWELSGRPNENSDPTFFDEHDNVVLTKNTRVGKEVVASGTVGIIVGLLDPTLSPKNREFIEVRFEGVAKTVWLERESVIANSHAVQETTELTLQQLEGESSDETPPTVH